MFWLGAAAGGTRVAVGAITAAGGAMSAERLEPQPARAITAMRTNSNDLGKLGIERITLSRDIFKFT